MSRKRAFVLAPALIVATAVGAQTGTFSTPDAADEALRAKDLPFLLHYDSGQWRIRPQRSQLELLARVVHKEGVVSGAFDYRSGALTAAQAKRREISELESAFASHALGGFERRRVNGHEVLFMRARAETSEGHAVVIRSYLWLGEEGIADYGVVVNADRFERYRPEMMALLNGFDLESKEGIEP